MSAPCTSGHRRQSLVIIQPICCNNNWAELKGPLETDRKTRHTGSSGTCCNFARPVLCQSLSLSSRSHFDAAVSFLSSAGLKAIKSTPGGLSVLVWSLLVCSGPKRAQCPPMLWRGASLAARRHNEPLEALLTLRKSRVRRARANDVRFAQAADYSRSSASIEFVCISSLYNAVCIRHSA